MDNFVLEELSDQAVTFELNLDDLSITNMSEEAGELTEIPDDSGINDFLRQVGVTLRDGEAISLIEIPQKDLPVNRKKNVRRVNVPKQFENDAEDHLNQAAYYEEMDQQYQKEKEKVS